MSPEPSTFRLLESASRLLCSQSASNQWPFDRLHMTTGDVVYSLSFSFIKILPETDTVSHVNFGRRFGDMAVESCGLVAIHAWQGVSSTRLHDQSSSSRAKLESDRCWWSLVLDNGTLRLSGSEPKTWWTGECPPPPTPRPPSNSLFVARVGNVELDRYPQPMLLGEEGR